MSGTKGTGLLGSALVRRAAALTAGVIAAGMAAIVTLHFFDLRAAALDASVEAKRSTVALMADQMEGGVKWGRIEVVQSVIERLTAQPDVGIAFVAAFDAAGATLAQSPAGASFPEALEAVGAAVAMGRPVEIRADGHVFVAAPIGELGAAVVGWDTGSVTSAAAESAVLSALAGLVIALAAILVSVLYLSRAVSRPVMGLADSVTRVAGGELNAEIPGVGRADEIGRMAASVERLRAAAIEKIEVERDAAQARASAEAERVAGEEERSRSAAEQAEMVAALTEAVHRLAKGDLTHRVTTQFPIEHKSLRYDLNSAFETLQSSIGRIVDDAISVRGATNAITSASDELSKRTESQAASLEESAAALEQIASTTRKTADSAALATTTVGRAKREAESGGEVARDAVAAMGAIEESSEKIGQIIGVIDEIAFQTNLLALNAGVEAARAGEAGRGFAVVASEVRALAQRSADAAKQIKDLILSSKGQVERGVKLVDGAGAALERIIAGVAEINAAVDEISVSAREQATGLNEVSRAVGEMDRATQQNAGMVEEVTSAVRELSRQADGFAELVERFHTGARAAAPRAGAAVAPKAPAKPVAAKPAPVAVRPAANRAAGAAASIRPAAAKPIVRAVAPARAAAAADAGWEEF